MSKYQLEDLLNEIQGTGRIGTYINSYKGLLDQIKNIEDELGASNVKKLGPSGDNKVPFEFEINPGNVDGMFSVYPFKFDPSGDDLEGPAPIHKFSIGGKPVAIDRAKALLGQGAYSNAEIRDAEKELGDEFPSDLKEKDDKPKLPQSIKDKEERDAEIEAKKAKGMMKEEEGFVEVNQDEIRFHLDAYEAGTIDGDDLAKAIEEIVFGEIKAPGMNEESINEELGPTGIAISQKQLDDIERLGAIAGLEVYVQDKDGSNVRKVSYTLSNTDYEKDIEDVDMPDRYSDLQEHFGRFMKDYQ